MNTCTITELYILAAIVHETDLDEDGFCFERATSAQTAAHIVDVYTYGAEETGIYEDGPQPLPAGVFGTRHCIDGIHYVLENNRGRHAYSLYQRA